MNTGVIIRTYEDRDQPALKEVFFSNVPVYFHEQEWPDFDEFLRADVGKECHYDVVEKDGKPVGAGGIALNEDNTVSLCWGMVRADLHKTGLGKALLEHRLKRSEELFPGCPLTVSTSQHAYGFFERFGFDTFHIETNFWAKGIHLFKMEKRS
jgi:ribosomal-protein-alanine N-acetyltransferase